MLRLNRIQRAVAIGTAVVLVLVQGNGIIANGLEENRGWMWAFLLAAVLLGLGFTSGGTDAAPGSTSHLQQNPEPVKTGVPSEEQMQRFSGHLNRAMEALNANGVMSNQLLSFVETHGLYHSTGTLGFVMDPNIHAALLVHALSVAALEESSAKPEKIVWETYRATLINRLAERRAKSMGELPVPPSKLHPEASAAAIKDAMVQHVRGEMSIWEEVARKSVRDGQGGTSRAFLKHVAATFGGRATEADDRRFEGIVRDLKVQAAKLVANMSRQSGAPAT